MIPDQWYVILESNEVKKGKPVGVTRLGETMVVWRSGSGAVYCAVDLCPHRGAALSLGGVVGECIQCPFHGFEYEPDGRCRYVPANGKSTPVAKALHIKAYPAREAYNYIWIWWGEPRTEYPALPFFEELGEKSWSYTRLHDPWAVHYTRAVENQLDVFHLPFIHATTIGRGNKFVADGPVIRQEGEKMYLWVYNRAENGIPARRADELPQPKREPFLKFIFPNVWMNNISPDMRITVCFVPVDDEHTILYLRNYQRFMRVPVLRELVNLGIYYSSIVILNQDKRVVLTQWPVKSELRMEEKLIPQDRPIIIFRSHTQELLEKAGK